MRVTLDRGTVGEVVEGVSRQRWGEVGVDGIKVRLMFKNLKVLIEYKINT